MSIYGYIRVSSRDQNEDRQLIALKKAAAACDMPVGTFYGKARKFENVA